MYAEFDQFSDAYEDLLKDPILDQFAPSGRGFFNVRKLEILNRFFRDRGLDNSRFSLLDVGCGKGDFLKLAASSFRQLAGCDPSERMLAGVNPGTIDARLQRSPTEIPFDSHTFDVLTAICVFHHVSPDDRPMICAEMNRVLRQHGVMCLIEHNPFNPVTQVIVRRTPVDAGAKLLTPALSKRLVCRAGFAVIAIRYFLYMPEAWFGKMGWLERLLSRFPLGGQYAIFCRKVVADDSTAPC